MTSVADIQARIDETRRLLGEMYVHDPRYQITEIHLQNLERELAVARSEYWRKRREEVIDKLAEVSNAVHRRTDSRVTY